jgi:hypothetical protein
MSSTDYRKAHHRGDADELLAPRLDGSAPKPISSNRLLGSLKEAAGWPGADRNTVVTLALLPVHPRSSWSSIRGLEANGFRVPEWNGEHDPRLKPRGRRPR